MFIMANTICHAGYCEPTETRKDSLKSTLGDNAVTVGYVLFGLVVAAIVWYGFLYK
jgi:hypothetical protein